MEGKGGNESLRERERERERGRVRMPEKSQQQMAHFLSLSLSLSLPLQQRFINSAKFYFTYICISALWGFVEYLNHKLEIKEPTPDQTKCCLARAEAGVAARI